MKGAAEGFWKKVGLVMCFLALLGLLLGLASALGAPGKKFPITTVTTGPLFTSRR